MGEHFKRQSKFESISKLLRSPVKLSVIISGALLTLTACSTTPSAGAACQIFNPINASDEDTRGTKNQVAVHNAKGVRVCKWKAPE